MVIGVEILMGLMKRSHRTNKTTRKKPTHSERLQALEVKAQQEIDALKLEVQGLRRQLNEARQARPQVGVSRESWRDPTIVPSDHPDYDLLYSDFGPK
jgi:hypothetical protein